MAGLHVKDASLFVRGLKTTARVGVYDRERKQAQPVLLDLELGLKHSRQAACGDRVADTVDYEAVTKMAKRLMHRRHYQLVENLAHTVASAVLELPGVSWVRVRLEKLGCLPDADGAGTVVNMALDAAHPDASDTSQGLPPQEVVIMGGGVAGLSAALLVEQLGHRALVVDVGPQLGGQLHKVHRPMSDLPGMAPATGRELARELWGQFAQHKGRWVCGRAAVVVAEKDSVIVNLAGQVARIGGRSLIVASGVRRKRLGVPGEKRFLGKGILLTAARDIEHLERKMVVVVGGGDAAAENSLLLAQAGARVTLVHRGSELTARVQFRQAVTEAQRVSLLPHSKVLAFEGEEHLEAVRVFCEGKEKSLSAQAALVRIGWLPNSAGLPAGWLDDGGYLRVDSDGRVKGEQRVFGAGDILNPLSSSVAHSMGSGATAAKAACAMLESEV